MDASEIEHEESGWLPLYRIGGIAALMTAVIIPIQVAVFLVWPPPTSVTDVLNVFDSNPLIGMLDLDLLLIVVNLLLVAVLVALYVALRRTNPSVMLLATVFGVLGVVLFIASREATVAMISLGNQFSTSAVEVDPGPSLAAGQAMMAIYNGTSFHASYIVGSLVGIAIGWVMLRSGVFGKVAAWAAIAGNVLAFGLYLPAFGVWLAILSALVLWVWYVLVARGLLRLARTGAGAGDLPSEGGSG